MRKGRGAWQYFSERMRQDGYETCNRFTAAIKLQGTQLALQNGIRTAQIGTPDFDRLRDVDLVVDMEQRFDQGEIRSLDDYMDLLHTSGNQLARVNMMKNLFLFERSINFCLLRQESNQIGRQPTEVLEDYIGEHPSQKTIAQVKKAVRKSGHSELIRDFIEKTFYPVDKKKLTYVIRGPSNCGKTKFKEMIMDIFPCEIYQQVIGSRFDVYYRKRRQQELGYIKYLQGCQTT